MSSKKIILCASCAMVLSLFFLNSKAKAATIVDSGSCGDSLNYELNSDGVLTITGSGTAIRDASPDDYTGTPWYDYHKNIKSVVFDTPNLTTIGTRAFQDCTNITGDFNLPSTVTTIKTYGLSQANITSIDLSNVTTIGVSAFSSCEKLADIVSFAENVTIDSSAFFETALTDITITKGSTVGYDSFFKSKLENITIDKGVVSIGRESFLRCTSLETVTFKENNLSIDASAFAQINQGGKVPTLILPDDWKGNPYVNNTTEWYKGCFNLYSKVAFDTNMKNGSGTITSPAEKYDAGSTLEFEINPNSGYYIPDDGLYITYGSNGKIVPELVSGETNVYTFTVPYLDATIVCNFAKSHVHGNGEKIDSFEPGCTSRGFKECYKCSCGNYYEDKECTKLIGDDSALALWRTEGNGKIEALGHDFTITYTWNEDYSKCEAKQECRHNDSSYSLTVDTFIENGKYVANFDDPVFETQYKDYKAPSKKMGAGAIIGITIGSLFFLLLIILIVLYELWRNKDIKPLFFLVPLFRKINKILHKTEYNKVELEEQKKNEEKQEVVEE